MTYVLNQPARPTIAALIDTHGTWRTFVALLQVLANRWQTRAQPGRADLPAHLRHDIGLPPVPETRRHWEIR